MMNRPTRKVMSIVRPWAPYLIVAGIVAIIMSYMEQLVPVQVRSVVNATFGKGSVAKISWSEMATLVALLMTLQLLRVAQRLTSEWASTRVGARLLQQGVLHLLSNPVTWFNRNHSGALQVRLAVSTRAIADLLKLVLSDILSPVVGLVIAAAIMLNADITVGVCAAVVIPVLVLLTLWQAKSQAGIRVSINQAREEQGIRIVEAAEGIEQVKLFDAQENESERAGRVSQSLADKEYVHHRAMAKFDLAKSLVEKTGFMAVLFFALVAALRPENSIGFGGVLMLVMLYERVTEPVRHLHRMIDETNEKWILAKDYLDILRVEPVARVRRSEHSHLRDCEVVFDNVTFAHRSGEEPVLKNVIFSSSSGTKVAILGKSGSGKSTLGKLLAGLYVPSNGQILVGGNQVRPIEEPGHGAQVGMLSQDVYIFHGTVAENILYGRPGSTEGDVRRAADLAGLAEVIAGLPDGYETQLGQRGNTLSGGQKQRLALARLILQDPDVIILDEPTSGLDPDNTQRFFQMIVELFKDRLVFVITHDWRNLQWADGILLVCDGQVRQCNSLFELDPDGFIDAEAVDTPTPVAFNGSAMESMLTTTEITRRH